MKFSLILTTLNRPDFLSECLKSLSKQIYKEFEVIIIDQSDDNKTQELIKECNYKFDIIYKKVKFKALSKARNLGIDISNGEYIALLDDDARYSENYLNEANNILSKYSGKTLILSGRIIDDKVNEEFVSYSCINDQEIFNDTKIFKVCLSAALILKKYDILKVKKFDENFGIGAYFGAAEETDLILRLIDEGSSIIHCSNMIVYHLKPKNNLDINLIEKTYKYALGGGALFKKHIIYRKKIKLIFRYVRSLIVPSVKMLTSFLNFYERKRYKTILIGHINGFLQYKE